MSLLIFIGFVFVVGSPYIFITSLIDAVSYMNYSHLTGASVVILAIVNIYMLGEVKVYG